MLSRFSKGSIIVVLRGTGTYNSSIFSDTFSTMLIILVIGLTVVNGLQHHDIHSFPGRNQRIIKLHSSPFKHHPHHKHIRPGPLGPHIHYHDHSNENHYEYIRPNRPPPIPPFVNVPKYGPSRPSYSPYKSSYGGPPYKSVNNFRSPVIKDHFRGPSFVKTTPTASPSFDYVPSQPSLNHVINSDDDRGPIHEIPAPNLGPKPDTKPIYHYPVEKKPSYEVVESNDKIIEQPDGSKGYYAPDPDPSLPAPKIPPTHDPHSIPSPSDKLNFPTGQEYQILEATPNIHAPIPNLSSQELFDLMHSFPNDQYTVVLPQSVNIYQPNSLDNSEIKQQYQDFNHPHYQTFNYEENNPNSGPLPMNNYYEQDTSESDNKQVIYDTPKTEEEKKTESVKKTLPNDLSNLIPDQEEESNVSPIFQLKNEPEVPFYSSLPNQETAEALAALQAAGSVANQLQKNEENPFGLPKNEILKPQQVGRDKTEVEVQKSVPLFETSYAAKSLSSSENDDDDVLANLDVGQGAISDRFGKKINPI